MVLGTTKVEWNKNLQRELLSQGNCIQIQRSHQWEMKQVKNLNKTNPPRELKMVVMGTNNLQIINIGKSYIKYTITV